jgi:hypothetical protein
MVLVGFSFLERSPAQIGTPGVLGMSAPVGFGESVGAGRPVVGDTGIIEAQGVFREPFPGLQFGEDEFS